MISYKNKQTVTEDKSTKNTRQYQCQIPPKRQNRNLLWNRHRIIVIMIYVSVIYMVTGCFDKNLIHSTPESPHSLPMWRAGTWEGIAYQMNSNSTWSMILVCDSNKNDCTIHYPSLNCGGTWNLVSSETNRATFTEKITQGMGNCIDEGITIITQVDDQHISFSYFFPRSKILGAFSTLRKSR